MRRKRIIKMSAYKVTPKIIASYVFGLVSFGVLILLCIFSAMSKGQAGFAAGIIPIIMMIFNSIFHKHHAYKLSLLEGIIYWKVIGDVYHDSFLAVVISPKNLTIDIRVISSIYYSINKDMVQLITRGDFHHQLTIITNKLKSL